LKIIVFGDISKETDHNVCKKNKQEYFHTQLFYKINDLSAEAVIICIKIRQWDGGYIRR